jgi:hypothetical protein
MTHSSCTMPSTSVAIELILPERTSASDLDKLRRHAELVSGEKHAAGDNDVNARERPASVGRIYAADRTGSLTVMSDKPSPVMSDNPLNDQARTDGIGKDVSEWQTVGVASGRKRQNRHPTWFVPRRRRVALQQPCKRNVLPTTTPAVVRKSRPRWIEPRSEPEELPIN